MSVATLVSLSLRRTAAHRPEKLSQTWHLVSQATWEPATSAPSRFPQLLMLHSPCSHSYFPIHGRLHCFQYFPEIIRLHCISVCVHRVLWAEVSLQREIPGDGVTGSRQTLV